MDLFLVFITMFLVANMMLVVTLLRRVDLNNPSVQAWEMQHAAARLQQAPATATFTPVYDVSKAQ
ncbi:hypothetical protein VT06_01870 [Arsukibacterium sp. MJ3]|jgi:hypothetical protein|uniref:hypothetical protein n=1 Tax=Arsukibacterium sp. MJ3 TaxID=1632859 RepID=UPI0006273927|nr:hypothetical protein [Arsukibacterium sp. MJ3]KKO50225.1 hypothetical protein VT06_01870 [Arsukibacterium sp. MJ3]